jgi:polysaccharide export outer membrane protein
MIEKKIKNVLIFTLFLLIVSIQSCGINSDLMLKTPKDYKFDKIDIDSANLSKNEYIIHVNDVVKFQFFTNNGIRVLDIVSGASGGTQGQVLNTSNSMNYTIMSDSIVKMPILGDINLVGMSIREAELFLETSFSEFYVDPFVQVSVTNKRVIVFPGSGGDAQVVYLKNNNTTLLEVLALAGGITDRGRAKRIKLIRDLDGVKKVFLIDLSTIEGLQYTGLVIQNGDYVYVEPVPELGKEILQEIAPIFSIITSTFSIVYILTN